MALLFADGFDHYAVADILKKWTGFCTASVITSFDIRPEYARPPGGMGMLNNSTGTNRGVYKTFTATQVSFVSGFNFYPLSSSGASAIWGVFDSTSGVPAATYQLGLKLDGAGHLQVFTATATILATSTNTFSATTWYHIEIKATINNTTGTYEVRVNGSSVGWIPAATGKNTRGQSANNWIDIVALEPTVTGGGHYSDDFYFLTSTAPNNDFLGPYKILCAYPSGAGNYAQWTGNYAANFANVNETTADGDQTFNQSATANQIDSFAFDDVPSGTIAAVQFVLEARQDAGAARTIAPFERAAAGPTDHALTSFVMAGSYLCYLDPRDVDPDTAAAWTTALFNSNEYGYKEIS